MSDQGTLRDSLTGLIIEPKAYASKKGGTHYRRFRDKYLHHIVLEAFVGPRPPGMQCRHLNGNSLDNRLENLQWGTAREDNYDRVRHGTHQHSRRTRCKHGHLFDGAILNPDGSVKQRTCSTCQRNANRRKKEKKRQAKTSCPQGHPLDGTRFNADGSVRQRFCTICVADQLDRGRRNRASRVHNVNTRGE